MSAKIAWAIVGGLLLSMYLAHGVAWKWILNGTDSEITPSAKTPPQGAVTYWGECVGRSLVGKSAAPVGSPRGRGAWNGTDQIL